MDEELLITTVEGYKELYDPSEPKYIDNQRKFMIWREIGKILNQPAEACKARWKLVRNNYRRAKKLREINSKKGLEYMKAPKYDKILSFLIPYLPANTTNIFEDMTFDSSKSDEECDVSSMLTQEEDDTTSRVSTSIDVFQGKNKRQCRKRKTNEDYDNDPLSFLLKNEYNEKSAERVKKKFRYDCDPLASSSSNDNKLEEKHMPLSSDRILNFFLNIGETVKTFPEDKQIIIKRKIFNLVSEAEEEIFLQKIT